ncbi:S-adenosyl-L-methionine-dependent methyltransferase [Plectosphaerella cucumerina]|uniref:S-adenosyl-L-methionine-dependent methyltransferase n=1 Tax=Plectosphaerella cucumerina TaxID=40658 RepID=A0A8K0X7C1_9PEZI|nr:S-adenosyl-L-methionine-dependent methyltransferase [Plectosphaerella cucumerina]
MADNQDTSGPVLVADDVVEQNDPTLTEDAASSTASVSTSIYNYRRENGRTYHAYKDGKYALPNDEQESDRLDLQHNLFTITFDNKLGLAPPNDADSDVKNVLDIGTGTGIWATDFGDEHPGAKVIGVDLSPIQSSFVPPNVTFQIDDIEEEWTFSHNFDYIHSRFMNSSIANWRDLFKRSLENLEPGGYLELQEADLRVVSDDDSIPKDSALSRAFDLLLEASVKFGRAFASIPELADIMREVGFVDVTIERLKWPMNPWPKEKKYKEIGAWCYENFSSGLSAITMAPLTRAHGWTPEEVELFLVDVRKDMANRSIHAYWPIYSLYGKKPLVETSSEAA